MTKQEIKEKFKELINSFEKTSKCKLSEEYKHVVNVDFNAYLNLIESLSNNEAEKLTEYGCEYANAVLNTYKFDSLYEFGVWVKLFGKKKGDLVELFPNKIDLIRKIIAFPKPEYTTSSENHFRNENGEPVKLEANWWRDVQLQKHKLARDYYLSKMEPDINKRIYEFELSSEGSCKKKTTFSQELKPHQDEIDKRFTELRNDQKYWHVKPAFFQLKEELRLAGWNPEEYGLKDEPENFNRAYNKRKNTPKRNSGS